MISEETAIAIATAHRETRVARELLEKIDAGERENRPPDILDAYGRPRGLQLGVPTSDMSQRLFTVSHAAAKLILADHIEKQRGEIERLSNVALAEIEAACGGDDAPAEKPYFDVEAWLNAAKAPARVVTLQSLAGRQCWFGLDFSRKTGVCALALCAPHNATEDLHFGFDYGFDLWVKFWLPAETLRQKPDDHIYKAWAAADPPWIEVTGGETVDLDQLENDIFGIWKSVDGVELAVDPAHSSHVTTLLMTRGINCVDFPCTSRGMSAPMVLLDGGIRSGIVNHSANPVMDRMVANTIRRKSMDCRFDYPVAMVLEEPITGVAAALMAIGRRLVLPQSSFEKGN